MHVCVCVCVCVCTPDSRSSCVSQERVLCVSWTVDGRDALVLQWHTNTENVMKPPSCPEDPVVQTNTGQLEFTDDSDDINDEVLFDAGSSSSSSLPQNSESESLTSHHLLNSLTRVLLLWTTISSLSLFLLH